MERACNSILIVLMIGLTHSLNCLVLLYSGNVKCEITTTKDVPWPHFKEKLPVLHDEPICIIVMGIIFFIDA
jgi:hypothetical protein